MQNQLTETKNSQRRHLLQKPLAGLILGSVFMAISCFAQGPTIEGTVRGANGKPLKGMDVRLEAKGSKSNPATTKTDAAGNYHFANVERGVYRVTVLSGNAVQGFIDNVQGGSAASRRVDFDIKPNAADQKASGGKKAKHLVWVPESTGSHIGGHWVEVDDSGAAAGSERVEQKSANSVNRTINYSSGIKPGGN